MTAMLPAHLSESLNNLGDAARELVEEVRADREQRILDAAAAAAAQKRYNRRTTALLLVIAVLIASLWALAVANRRSYEQNAQIVSEIRSCTTEGGECSQKSQKRVEDAIRNLLRNNIAVAVCARTEPTEQEMVDCIKRHLSQPAASPGPETKPTD